MPLDLSGQRALITGASGGIGNAIARELHSRGAHVILSGRRADALESLAGDLGPRAEVIAADLADAFDVRSLLERAGKVDVLVANAALPGSGEVDSFSPEEIDRAIDVNLRAPIQMARELVPGMVERGRGHLVFVSSLSGKVAALGTSVYSATKFGLRGFAFSLHEDLRGTGVGVTTVFPSFIRGAGMWADTGLELPAGVRTRTPEQVAAAVVRGIDKNVAEIDVAPVSLRLGGWLFGFAPGVTAALSRLGGGRKLSAATARAQLGKR
ncbi:MAG TPA: SDR family NAD(P)-dependent oxidoreductase [Thermoleophilaceae bacterium]